MLNRRRVEVDRRKVEREERISLIIKARKQEREVKRKKIFYVRSEEEKIKRLLEEEEAHKREGIHINIFSCKSIIFFCSLEPYMRDSV